MDRRAAAAPPMEHGLVSCTRLLTPSLARSVQGPTAPDGDDGGLTSGRGVWGSECRWWDMFIIFTVFGITGSSTMFFVRPFITKFLKLEGTYPLCVGVLVLAATTSTSKGWTHPHSESRCRAGSMREGPWSYRLSSVALIMPMYSLILMCIGTTGSVRAASLIRSARASFCVYSHHHRRRRRRHLSLSLSLQRRSLDGTPTSRRW
jgi:hypothetical protein